MLSVVVPSPCLVCPSLVINRMIIENYLENYSERLPQPKVTILLLACFNRYLWLLTLFAGENLVFLWKPRKLETTVKLFRKWSPTVWKTSLKCLLRFATAMFGRHQLKVEVYWKAKVQSGSGLENQLKDFDLNAALCEVLKTPTKTGSSCRLNTV